MALVALFVAAAGCTSAPSGKETPAAAKNETPRPDMPRPDGRNGTFLAFEETNKTEAGSGGAEHRHDYWAGRLTVPLVDADVGLVAILRPAPGGAAAIVRLAPGALVYEGASQVTLTFSNPQRRACEPIVAVDGELICGPPVADPSGGPAGLKVQARHGTSSTWVDVGTVDWAKPLVIPIKDPRMTDMPHATSTLWAFRVASDDNAQQTLVFHLKAEAQRASGDVPLWPGHANFYATSHERQLFQGSVDSRESGLSSAVPNAPQDAPTEVVPKKLVSYGTRTLAVHVNVTSAQSTLPAAAISGWFLEVHNASDVWKAATIRDAADKGFTWVLAVSDDGMDSPYAEASRWGFRLRAIMDSPVLSCTGCAPYEVKYDMTIVASDLKAEAYDKLADFPQSPSA